MKNENCVQDDFIDIHIPVKPEEKNHKHCIYVWLNVTKSGDKYGLSYDTNCWNSETNKCFKTLLKNEWDKLYALEWEPVGGEKIVIAENNGKKCAFSLSCNSDYDTDKLKINIKKLCPCVYDKIEYGFSCEDILLFYKDNKVSFCDLSINYFSDFYDAIYESEICKTVLFLNKEDKTYFYSLKKEMLSDAYTYISCIDDNFIECYTDSDNTIVNVCGETQFPKPSWEYYYVTYQCNYNDGVVYRVVKNCTNKGEPWWTSYLVFYSIKSDNFYVTDVFEQIKVHAVAPERQIYYISGIECLKDGVWSIYQGESTVGCDEGIKKLPIIKDKQHHNHRYVVAKNLVKG